MSILDTIRHLTREDGDCLMWTGGCANGRPASSVRGKWVLLRRVMFEEANGPIPAGRILRVTCGSLRCLNADHCKLTTYKAVALECGAKGLMSGQLRSAKIAASKRAGPQAKISQSDAEAIRASDDTGKADAERYGISLSAACRIKRGEARREFSSPWAVLKAAP